MFCFVFAPLAEIISELANRMSYSFSHSFSEQVMQEVAKLTPLYAGVTHARLGATRYGYITFHYKGTHTNVLTNGASDKVSKTYECKACGVKIEGVTTEW